MTLLEAAVIVEVDHRKSAQSRFNVFDPNLLKEQLCKLLVPSLINGLRLESHTAATPFNCQVRLSLTLQYKVHQRSFCQQGDVRIVAANIEKVIY